MAGYLGDEKGEAKVFFEALDFAVKAHEGQWRKSGDAYINHPCNVALILVAEMDIRDPEILAAALLHDTVEDVPEVTTQVIGHLFGPNVAAIVDGCTKISYSARDRQTFYKLVHRKIFTGAASRLEVMLVKMADRLHNLRTLNAMPRHKRQKVAEETLDIYAPMARVMGLFNLKRELYNLALHYKFPRQSGKLAARIRQYEDRAAVLEVAARLRAALQESHCDCRVSFRVKGLWAYFDPIHKRLHSKVTRPVEFIILAPDPPSCYQALGVLNLNYPPIPRTIRDYIANPKPTGYQGLHAKANIKGENYLFKIRTEEMARRAQRGIIFGWSGQHTMSEAFEQDLRTMFDLLGTEEELSYREVISASGGKEIYTYTPKGDRICLPRESIVLDFAYQVHTAIGDRCTGAIINSRKVGPDQVLRDGDQVRISRQEEPVLFAPDLQARCQTPRARAGLAKGLRLRRQAVAREVGRSILQQELKRYGVPFDLLAREEAALVLRKVGRESMDELFQFVGEGKQPLKELVRIIIEELYADRETLQPPTGALNRIDLATLDPVSIKFSACCKPVPTEKGLFGLLREQGLSVHRQQCERIRELELQREEVLELRWRLKETPVLKPQMLLLMKTPRNRVMMMLSVAPAAMRIVDVISLSPQAAKLSDWEINFTVASLYDLKNILHHFTKAGLIYEFILEQ